MLPTFNTGSKNLDITKQMSMMRTYLSDLKDQTESELYDIKWDNLSKPLKEKIDGLDAYMQTTNQFADMTAQNLKANYLTANTIRAEYLTASQIQADYLTASQIQANYLTAQQIVANYATIGNLNALSAKVGTIESNYVSTNYLQSNYITSSQISANYASFGYVNGEIADVRNLFADYATIGSLNALSARVGTVEANKITAADVTASLIAGRFNSFSPYNGLTITTETFRSATLYLYDGQYNQYRQIHTAQVKDTSGTTRNFLYM